MVTWKYEICFEELQGAMLCYPMVIFTLVKITCFFTRGDITFTRKSSPGISLLFI